MNKLIIANTGTGNQGKSSSIKEVYNLLVSRYPNNVQIIHPVKSGDVKAIVDVKGVCIGIESQGDPNSRMFQSLQDFLNAGCDIVVIACRTSGETYKAVKGMHQYGYQVIWTANDKNRDEKSIVYYLNMHYAQHILQLIEDRIANIY